eukprot:Phypoly_transcript_02691.p1 GENE.Phypoly_transcript_02691~~Phypoly_transcript_02691.p1  ORF type:complete len:856 (+),score=214.40 Phypoly_transcript_02691:221-2569(+)
MGRGGSRGGSRGGGSRGGSIGGSRGGSAGRGGSRGSMGGRGGSAGRGGSMGGRGGSRGATSGGRGMTRGGRGGDRGGARARGGRGGARRGGGGRGATGSRGEGKEKFQKKEEEPEPFKKFAEEGAEENKEESREAVGNKREKKVVSDRFLINFNKIKQIWEKARLQDLKSDARKVEIAKMVKLIGEDAREYFYKSDGSRILQTVLKWGNSQQRQNLITQVLPEVLSVTQHTFSHFFLQKSFEYGDKKQRSQILNALQGHVVQVFRGKFGARVIEKIYKLASPRDQKRLVSEFYGRELALFQKVDENTNFKKYLTTVTPAKKQALLNTMKDKLVNLLSTKGESVVGYTFLHTVLFDYLSNADPAGIRELVSVLSTLILYFIHTSMGSKVGAYCFMYSDVKERKQMLKSMKEHIEAIAFSRYAYQVVLVALATVDDTALSSKSLLVPLLPSLFQAATHPFTSHVLLSILTTPSRKYLDQQELSFISEVVKVPSKEKTGEMVPASLKNPVLRREQLVEAISEPLIDMCTENTQGLVASSSGANILYLVAQLAQGKEPVHKALYTLVQSTSTDPALYEEQLAQREAEKAQKEAERLGQQNNRGDVAMKEASAEEEGGEEEEGDEEEGDEEGDEDEEEEEDKDKDEDEDEDEDEDKNENEDEEEGGGKGDKKKGKEDGNNDKTTENLFFPYWMTKSGTVLMTKLMKEDSTLVTELAKAFENNFSFWSNKDSDASYCIRDILLLADAKLRKKIIQEISRHPPIAPRIAKTLEEIKQSSAENLVKKSKK